MYPYFHDPSIRRQTHCELSLSDCLTLIDWLTVWRELKRVLSVSSQFFPLWVGGGRSPLSPPGSATGQGVVCCRRVLVFLKETMWFLHGEGFFRLKSQKTNLTGMKWWTFEKLFPSLSYLFPSPLFLISQSPPHTMPFPYPPSHVCHSHLLLPSLPFSPRENVWNPSVTLMSLSMFWERKFAFNWHLPYDAGQKFGTSFTSPLLAKSDLMITALTFKRLCNVLRGQNWQYQGRSQITWHW